MQTTLETLKITHNHGVITMRDVTLTIERRAQTNPYWVRMSGPTFTAYRVVGTPVSGGWTSRLFTATSFTPVDTTKPMEWDLGTSEPLYNNRDGAWHVDVCFCG